MLKTVRLALWPALLMLGTAAALSAAKTADTPAAKPAGGPARWESEVQAYEKNDKVSPPPQGAVLFVGSSTIRIWKSLEDDFKPLKVFARGVGGCQAADVTYYADRIVIPYKPRQIVFYAGDNDLAAHRTAEQVLEDFRAFVEKVHKALPDVKIHFISIKPSPSRAKFWDEAQKANRLIREFIEKTPHTGYINTVPVMLDAAGKPRAELFKTDMLHMNPKGYELWTPIIKAALENPATPS